MSFETVNSSYTAGRNITNAQKRQLLWNILEPGDTYDIKKSLIAKLPGDRKVFMGDSIEVVCLLQAAEIQRLIEYLDEYKLKYKEIERRELDRHSYEVQIKQLTEKILETEGIRNDNNRLKDFIRKLTSQLEEHKKRAADRDQINIQAKYDQSLAQLEAYYAENNMLKAENNNLRNQMTTWRNRLEALDKTRIKELEDLRGSLEIQRKSQIERESRQLSLRFNYEKAQLESEIKRLRDILEGKGREIDDFRMKISSYEARISELMSKTGNVQLEARLSEYQNKIALLSQQVERLTRQLRDKTNEANDLSNRLRSYEGDLVRKDSDTREYERRNNILEQEVTKLQRLVNELQGKASDNSEMKLAQMSMQIQRLNDVLKTTMNEKLDLSSRLGRAEYEVENLRKAGSQDITQIKMQYESKITIMTQQLDRLNGEIKMTETKYSRLEGQMGKLGDFQKLTKKNSDLELSVSRLNSDLGQARRQLGLSQGQLQQFRRKFSSGDDSRRIAELESNLSALKRQNERLQDLSRRTESDVNNKVNIYIRREEEYTRRIQEFQDQVRKILAENDGLKRNTDDILRSKTTTYEQRIIVINKECQDLRRQNGDLRRRIQELTDPRNNADLEGRIALFSKEIQRLNEALRVKVDEGNNWENRYRQLSAERDELNRMAHELQRRLQESGDLARRIAELENRNAMTKAQADRLVSQLRVKSDEVATLDSRYRQAITERDELNRSVSDLQRQMQNATEGRISSLNMEIDKLNGMLNRLNSELNEYKSKYPQLVDENNNLKRKIQELTQRQESDWKSRSINFEQRILVLTQEGDQYKRKAMELEAELRRFIDLEGKVGVMSSEIERLNMNLRNVVGENEEMRRRLAEFETANRKLIDLQSRISLLTQENERYAQTLQQRNNDLSILNQKLSEVDSLTRNAAMLQERTNMLANENKNLVEELRNAKDGLRNASGQVSRYEQELSQYKRRIQELESQIRRIPEYESRISSLTLELQKMGNTTRIIQELQNKIMIITKENEAIVLENQKIQDGIRNQGSQNNRLMNDLKDLQNMFNVARAENEDLKRKLIELNEYSRRYTELESRFVLASQDNERLNSLLEQRTREMNTLNQRLVDLDTLSRNSRQLQDRITKLTMENKNILDEYNNLQENARQMSSQNSRITSQLNEHKSKISMLVQENDQLKRRMQEMEQTYQQMSAFENRIAQMSMQIERLNNVLRNKIEESNMLQQNLNEYNIRLQKANDENNSLKNKMQEMMSGFNNEINIKVTTIQQKFIAAAQQNDQLKRRIIELENGSRRAIELEGRLSMLQPEVQRLTRELQHLNSELNEYKLRCAQLTEDNNGLKRRVQEEAQKWQYEANSRLGQANQELEQLKRKIVELENANRVIGEYDNKIGMLSTEINRLNLVLKSKLTDLEESEARYQKLSMEINEFRQRYPGLSSENQELKRRLMEFSQKFELELNSRTSMLEQRVAALTRELEEARRRLSEFESIARKSSEYESRIAIMTQEIERLNSKLGEKVDQLNRIENEWNMRYKQLESAAYNYEQQCSKYASEIERLNQLLRQKVQIESKSAQMINEIERLNNALRIKVQESQEWQDKFGQANVRFNSLIAENEQLRNANAQLMREYENLRLKIQEYDQKFGRINVEIEKLHKIIKDLKEQNYSLQMQLREQDYQEIVNKNHHLANEIKRLNAVIEGLNQELSELRIRFTDDTSLHKRIQEHLALFVVLFAEIESLRKRVKDKEKEVDEVRRTSLAPFVV